MVLLRMLIKVLPLLLQTLPADITNVALILLVLLQIISLFSKGTKGVNHEPTNDIAEQHFEESEVDDIVDESHDFKLLHGFAYDSRDIKLDDTGGDTIAHIFYLISC